MPAPQEIVQLVQRFRQNIEDYRSGRYNETQVRREFIDPFFQVLGWDIANVQGQPEAYKDVIHEDAIKIGDAFKAPDYSFRIGNTRKFFVEAKKPSVHVYTDIYPAFQLRRYGWSAGLPLCIVTDFEEFAVYDCRIEPKRKDSAATARVNYLTYDKYEEKWDEIAAQFSREAVLHGSLEKFAEETKNKRGIVTVDKAFLREIEGWRDALARAIAAWDRQLTSRDLNFAVQMIIDRIIFLRICEDRAIEPYGRLLGLVNGTKIYERLMDLFKQADDRYNSGLFHFQEERGREEAPDTLTPRLTIFDDLLAEIIKKLYYPDSPYAFSVIPVEILGQVYEQFLGKVITIEQRPGEDRRVVVEEKPEVRKAGGVYYTPTYIVDYIVRHTVGKLLEGKTPKQAEALRILDPACGSGSFLIGAYQYLLNWHRDWYVADGTQKHKKVIYQAQGGEWRLSTAERKRILLNNIYGVDIDPQAVETTKLSLLLRVLEGETDESINRQLKLFHERALPDLGSNIKCGNSLIGHDFYEQQAMGAVDDETRTRINAFDWGAEFPDVFRGHQRQLWFVTFVTHNSRISERMVTLGIKTDSPLVFASDDQILIAEQILEACQKYQIAVVACNVLPDHVHMIIAAETEDELNESVRKIKGYSSYAFQKERRWESGQHVWAQKFHGELIPDEKALAQIIEYVLNNHLKHTETWGDSLLETWDKGLKPLVEKACVLPEKALYSAGGFDAVIGNPPYIRIQSLKESAPLEVEFYKERYKAATKGNYDIYVVFVEKGLELLRANGQLGFILPHKFFNAQYGEPLREMVSNGKHLTQVVYFGDQQVFEGATTYTCLMFLDKTSRDRFEFVKVQDLSTWRETLSIQTENESDSAVEIVQNKGLGMNKGLKPLVSPLGDDSRPLVSPKLLVTGTIPASQVGAAEWNFSADNSTELFERLAALPVRLGDLASIFVGLQTSADRIYIVQEVASGADSSGLVKVKDQRGNEWDLEREILKPFLNDVSLSTYEQPIAKHWLIFPYKLVEGKMKLIPSSEIKSSYPQVWKYLEENADVLRNRESGKANNEQWYGYIYRKNLTLFDDPKLIVQVISQTGKYAYDENALYFTGGGNGPYYGIRWLIRDNSHSLHYLQALLGSKLLDSYLHKISSPFRGGYWSYGKRFIEQLPIRAIDFNDPADRARHDRVVALVDQMLALHKQLPTAQTPQSRTVIERQIAATDAQIDRLVYELYGLTEEEIAIVEGK
jgi:type I restriction-modification system DNA methylase subunit/REP element-mobilizing transposase RayT/predicted type IV restriction endonuclease